MDEPARTHSDSEELTLLRTSSPTAPRDEVEAEVKRLLGIFAPGGGYVFNQMHNIQADVPPENIVAMLETASSP